jgi:hypothetical protein
MMPRHDDHARAVRTVATLAALLGASVACGGDRPADARDTAAAVVPVDTPTAAPESASGWAATATGLGPLRTGMSVAEARGAVGGDFAAPDSGCVHVPVSAAPGRVLAMVVDGRVARLEVKDSLVATDRGARVGDTEARVDSLYLGHVRAEPHKYTDGRYLVVTPPSPADSAYRLVFETDGQRVLEYRMGLLPMVSWVEGCS